ncbi:MAG: putative permease, superfamily [Herbinix sp.]|jgi:drug/metabolite transporter (DMT)-like permease|nr:putative permease, superfamily [Herbinix sp.]
MKKAYFKYIIALLLFGTNGIVASDISLSSYEIVYLRTLIGSILLVLIFVLTKGKLSFLQKKKQLLFLAVSGIALGTSWIFLYEAYQQIGVSFASLAYYCGPVIVMILAPILFQERLTITKGIGFLTVLVGIFMVNGQLAGSGANRWGLFCGTMSAVMYSIMVIFNKKAKDITGLENSMLQLIFSFMTVAVFVTFQQGLNIHIERSDVAPVLILGLLNTGIGCYLYFSSIGRLGVQTVAICGYLEPLSAVVFSVLLLREGMSLTQVIGATLILFGAISGELFELRNRRVGRARC